VNDLLGAARLCSFIPESITFEERRLIPKMLQGKDVSTDWFYHLQTNRGTCKVKKPNWLPRPYFSCALRGIYASLCGETLLSSEGQTNFYPFLL